VKQGRLRLAIHDVLPASGTSLVSFSTWYRHDCEWAASESSASTVSEVARPDQACRAGGAKSAGLKIPASGSAAALPCQQAKEGEYEESSECPYCLLRNNRGLPGTGTGGFRLAQQANSLPLNTYVAWSMAGQLGIWNRSRVGRKQDIRVPEHYVVRTSYSVHTNKTS
jgi:hypothetical protein